MLDVTWPISPECALSLAIRAVKQWWSWQGRAGTEVERWCAHAGSTTGAPRCKSSCWGYFKYASGTTMLHNWGAQVQVFLTHPAIDFTPVPAHQLDILQRMNVPMAQ